MRRDYFTCVFLLYVAVSLTFVCFLPSHFLYGEIIPREIGLVERIASMVAVVFAILIIPIVSAFKKRLWITIGASIYGVLAYLPEMLISKMDSVLTEQGASTSNVVKDFLLKAIYQMVNAPYAGISELVGDKYALLLPKLIMPVSIISYILVQLFRFYQQAYIAEQMLPVADATHKVDKPNTAARKPEILGTVISAPVTPKTNTNASANANPNVTVNASANTSNSAVSSQTQVHQVVNPNQVRPVQQQKVANPLPNKQPVEQKAIPKAAPVQNPKAVIPPNVSPAPNVAPVPKTAPAQATTSVPNVAPVQKTAPKAVESGNESRVINLGAPATPVNSQANKPSLNASSVKSAGSDSSVIQLGAPVNPVPSTGRNSASAPSSNAIQLGAPNPNNNNNNNHQ